MKSYADVLLILVSFALAFSRIFGEKGEIFQATAHLFVGGLIGAWLCSRRSIYQWEGRSLYGWLVVILSVVEVACFFLVK